MLACAKLRNDLHTALRQSRVENIDLIKRTAVLLSEVTKAAASIEERDRKIQELEATIQKRNTFMRERIAALTQRFPVFETEAAEDGARMPQP